MALRLQRREPRPDEHVRYPRAAQRDGFLPQGALEAIAEGIDGVEAAEERLISQTQVEVDTGDGSIFVPGRIIGVDMSDGGPSVNGVETIVGRAIEEGEIGEPVVLIERNFGVYYELPDEGGLRLGEASPLGTSGTPCPPNTS